MGAQTITEVKRGPDPADIRRQEEELERQRQEKIKRLNEAVGPIAPGVNVFESTQPIAKSDDGPGKALSGVSPNDPGVDITGIMRLAGGKWDALKG
jgi:LPS O-antigen subunit length determinant protein (WzzB/FepE family)